jgi:ABC-type ATPase involved in cell division
MLALHRVSKWYGPNAQAKVLDHVDLTLKSGDFLYIVGGTGAGKSTLLRMLASLELPSEGSVTLMGVDVARANGSTLQGLRRSIGYIPQDLQLLSDFTVEENIAIGARWSSAAARRSQTPQSVGEWVERLKLGDVRHKRPAELSGGEAQRVAIARALVRQPQLIVADEPTGAQDKESIWTVMEGFVKSAAAITLVATHDREVVRRLRKRCAVLENGTLRLEEASCIY